jgi:tetratricopeptide (TPR) repeat protein
VEVLQKAADAFKAKEDKLQLAMTLSNLALAYQQLGQWQQAQEAIAQSLKLLNSQNTQESSEKRQIIA